MSDHYPCLVNIQHVNKCNKDKVRITKRKITDESIGLINERLSTMDWHKLDYLTVNDAFNDFHSTVTKTIDEICPKKDYLVRHDRIIRDPWLTKGLQNSLKTQKRLYKAHLHETMMFPQIDIRPTAID